jgi:peptidoglycan/LPS O-acetylase OafA/YrhL
LSTRAIALLCSLWAGVICLGAIIVIHLHGAHVDGGILEWLFALNPFTRLLDFLAGMLTYRLFSSVKRQPRLLSEGFAVLLLLVTVALYGTHKLPDVLRYQITYLPVMALVIFSFARGDGFLSKLLCNRTLVMLGDASFSLYLIHQPILVFAHDAYLGRDGKLSTATPALLVMALCIVLAVIVYKCVEHPLHRYLKRVISRINWQPISRAYHPLMLNIISPRWTISQKDRDAP